MVTLTPEAALVTPEGDADERGFGVVEIVISMFLLLIISAAFLPLLITAVKTSSLNVSVATATQIVNEQLGLARSEISSCSTLTTYGAFTPSPVVDPRGIELSVARSVHLSDCPVAIAPATSPLYPAIATVRVSVADPSGAVMAQGVALVKMDRP